MTDSGSIVCSRSLFDGDVERNSVVSFHDGKLVIAARIDSLQFSPFLIEPPTPILFYEA